MKKLIACALVALCATGASKADTIGIHIASHHWPNEDYNNANFGMYYRADGGLTMGAYCNSQAKLSECRVSPYIGWTFETRPLIGGLTLAVTPALAFNYKAGPVWPTLMPSVSGPLPLVDGWRWRLSGMPKIHPKQDAAVAHLSIEREF